MLLRAEAAVPLSFANAVSLADDFHLDWRVAPTGTRSRQYLDSSVASAPEIAWLPDSAAGSGTLCPIRDTPSHPPDAAQHSLPGHETRGEIVSAGSSRSRRGTGRRVANSCVEGPAQQARHGRSVRRAWLPQ